MDLIRITDLEVFAHHGVLPEETVRGQLFYVSCELGLDLALACKTDDLAATINYAEACHLIHQTMTTKTRQLIEAAAQDAVQALLDKYPQVKTVKIELKKPHAPIGLPFGCVSVVIERSR